MRQEAARGSRNDRAVDHDIALFNAVQSGLYTASVPAGPGGVGADANTASCSPSTNLYTRSSTVRISGGLG